MCACVYMYAHHFIYAQDPARICIHVYMCVYIHTVHLYITHVYTCMHTNQHVHKNRAYIHNTNSTKHTRMFSTRISMSVPQNHIHTHTRTHPYFLKHIRVISQHKSLCFYNKTIYIHAQVHTSRNLLMKPVHIYRYNTHTHTQTNLLYKILSLPSTKHASGAFQIINVEHKLIYSNFMIWPTVRCSSASQC